MSEISEFITTRRNGRNERVGVLVADKVNNVPCIGWSLCHVGKDTFTREEALQIARDRIRFVAKTAASNEGNSRKNQHPIPHTIKKRLSKFVTRCKRYFKAEAEPEVWGDDHEPAKTPGAPKPKTYAFHAKNADGEDVKGTREAANVGALAASLKREGLIVINVEDAPAG